MPIVKIEPTDEHDVPYDTEDDVVVSQIEELAVAGNTAELQEALGVAIEVSEEDVPKTVELLEAAAKGRQPIENHATAYAAKAFLRSYASAQGHDAGEIRSALTNKLLSIADCGNTNHELRAIELLGKQADIGLFAERTEVNITYNSPEALEKAIKERVKRLLNADVIDITPMNADLDEELGFADAKTVLAKPSEGEVKDE